VQKRVRDSAVGAPGDPVATAAGDAAGEGVGKKKKKKKKPEPAAEI